MNNNKKKQTFFLIFSLALIFIFFYTGLIHETYVAFWKDSFSDWPFKTYSKFKYFGDTQTLFLAAECYKSGFDVFYGECISDYGIRTGHDYGRSLLYLPIIDENFKTIFLLTFGSILIGSLIFIVFKLINPKSIYENIICLILIFNPTTLLLFERLNLDLLIFNSLILIVFLRGQYIFKFLIKFLLFSFKYYPLIFIINFFTENNLKLKNKFFYALLLILISSTFIFFSLDDLKYVVSDFEKVGRNIKYSYSINSFSRTIDHFNLLDKNLIKPILILILVVFSTILHIFFNQKIKSPLDKEKNFYYPRAKLFLISTNLLIILYLFFNNNYFREVFFIGVVPYLLIVQNEKCVFSKVCLSLILFKYLFMIFFWPKVLFSDINNDIFSQLILGIKILLDYIIIIFLTPYIIKLNLILFKKSFKLSF
jgi:hypothetical protein